MDKHSHPFQATCDALQKTLQTSQVEWITSKQLNALATQVAKLDHDALAVREHEIQQHLAACQQKRALLGFTWTSTLYDLMGWFHDIKLHDSFKLAISLLIELIFIYERQTNANTLQQEHLAKLMTTLNQARRLGWTAKLYYRISWVVYVGETLALMIICELLSKPNTSCAFYCGVLKKGLFPYVFSLFSVISWASWGLFAIIYAIYRKKGFTQERAGLELIHASSD